MRIGKWFPPQRVTKSIFRGGTVHVPGLPARAGGERVRRSICYLFCWLVIFRTGHEIVCMTIHRIRLLGDPILRARCEPITKPKSTAVRVILDDMRETLRDWQSRFGSGRAIAAPQIGAPVRMIKV